ncbi:hypothetical protein ACFODQ_05800 [Comamonas sp. JC664]
MTVAAAASSAWSKRAPPPRRPTTRSTTSEATARSWSRAPRSTAAPGSIPCMCTPPMA